MNKEQLEIEELGISKDGVCEDCGVPAVFALKCGDQHFPLDLITVLQCLKMASDNGLVAPLPDKWWHETINHFNADV